MDDCDDCCAAIVDDMGAAALTRMVSMVERMMVTRCRCRDFWARGMSRMSEVECWERGREGLGWKERVEVEMRA